MLIKLSGAVRSFSFPASRSIKSRDVRSAIRQEVFHKIADAAMKLHGYGSILPVNEHVARALRQHLAALIRQGTCDNQTLLDEGVAFLRRQEMKRLK